MTKKTIKQTVRRLADYAKSHGIMCGAMAETSMLHLLDTLIHGIGSWQNIGRLDVLEILESARAELLPIKKEDHE